MIITVYFQSMISTVHFQSLVSSLYLHVCCKPPWPHAWLRLLCSSRETNENCYVIITYMRQIKKYQKCRSS